MPKEKVTAIKITKEFRRTYSGKDFGSITTGTTYAIELEVENKEELEKAAIRLAKRVRKETMRDLDDFLSLKEKGEVL